jgi:hypothetical protein
LVDEHGFTSYAEAKLIIQQKETSEMNNFSESIEKNRSKIYARDLGDGVKLEGEVGLCVFMYPGYPLQVTVILRRDHGESLGNAHAVNRWKTAQTATTADARRLLAGIRTVPCRRCSTPAFDPATVETNRDGLCEPCFMNDLEADLAKAEEAERQETAARDLGMKKKGMRVRVSAWVHPEEGGDDYQVDWYFANPPTAALIGTLLREEGSAIMDDYRIVTL